MANSGINGADKARSGRSGRDLIRKFCAFLRREEGLARPACPAQIARSSMFHLRLESRHRETYRQNAGAQRKQDHF